MHTFLFPITFHDSVQPHTHTTHAHTHQVWKSSWIFNARWVPTDAGRATHTDKRIINQGRGWEMIPSHEALGSADGLFNSLQHILCQQSRFNKLQPEIRPAVRLIRDRPHTAPLCHVVDAFIQSTLLCHDCLFFPSREERKANWTVLHRDALPTQLCEHSQNVFSSTKNKGQLSKTCMFWSSGRNTTTLLADFCTTSSRIGGNKI